MGLSDPTEQQCKTRYLMGWTILATQSGKSVCSCFPHKGEPLSTLPRQNWGRSNVVKAWHGCTGSRAGPPRDWHEVCEDPLAWNLTSQVTETVEWHAIYYILSKCIKLSYCKITYMNDGKNTERNDIRMSILVISEKWNRLKCSSFLSETFFLQWPLFWLSNKFHR